MKSQGDTDGVVLVTSATQLLPGHRAQISPGAQRGFCVAENKKKVRGRGNKRLEGVSGVEGHTVAAAALPHFNLMILFKVASQPRALQHKCRANREINNTFELQRKQILS